MLQFLESAFESLDKVSARKMVQIFVALYVVPCLAHHPGDGNRIVFFRAGLHCVDMISKLKVVCAYADLDSPIATSLFGIMVYFLQVVKKDFPIELSEQITLRFRSKIPKRYLPYESICYSLSQMLKNIHMPDNLKSKFLQFVYTKSPSAVSCSSFYSV